MVETISLQQMTDHDIRYPVPNNPELFKKQQLHITEDPSLASAALPLSALTANSAKDKQPPASILPSHFRRRRRCRPSSRLALQSDRPFKATRADHTSIPRTINAFRNEKDYYSRCPILSIDRIDPSSASLVNVYNFNTVAVILSKSISTAAPTIIITDDNADANAENPALLSTAAIRQQPLAALASLTLPSTPIPLSQQQVKPASSHWQSYSRPSSIIHSYQSQSASSVPTNRNLSPYRSPSTIASSQSVPDLGSTSEQSHLYTGQRPISYNTSVPNRYPPADTSELMAAAHMQRPPFSQSVYHTPQSSSPTSVVSQQNHHDYSRMFTSPPAQLNHSLQYSAYTASMNQLPSYGHQGHTQGHVTSASPLLMSHTQTPLLSLSHPSASTSMLGHSSTRSELDMSMQRLMDIPRPSSSLADPGASMGGMHHPPSSSGSGTRGSGDSTGNTSAPGPIPATTPLVVRQDGNGVQWIAFEYSRDRVKMEYTIRCDVESVDTENLDHKFKTENCVYPRACVPKNEYKGNRYAYESECNTVGWALADLNACLRTKRGLIQRAVDSWRNSNSDPKIRSRRVRRLAKCDKRKGDGVSSNSGHSQVTHLGQSRGTPRSPHMAMPLGRNYMNPIKNEYQHHRDAYSDGSITSGAENISEASPNEDIRPSHVFHDYPSYTPQQGVYATSTLPPSHDAFEGLESDGIQTAASTLVESTTKTNNKNGFEEPADKLVELYGDIPRKKYRKFILVKDEERKDYKECKDGKDPRSRIRVELGQVNLEEIPDSYRKANSVYPRVYYSCQFIEDTPTEDVRLIGDDEVDIDDDTYDACVSSTLVPIPLLNGEPLALPRISRSKRRREDLLNEISYRMLWSNNNTFPGRPMFMQKCLDLYRQKTRQAIENHGTQQTTRTISTQQNEATTIPPQFRLRIGRQKWEARHGRAAMVNR